MEEIDWKFVVGTIAAFLIQGAAFVWKLSSMNSTMNSRVAVLDDKVRAIETEQKVQERALLEINLGVARIDERTKAFSESFDRLVKRLDSTGLKS